MDKFLCLFVIVFSVSSASSLYAEGPTRITNGLPANENQFPYMVSLQRISEVHTTANRGHKCGGALVTLQHALTTAYCTLDRINEPPFVKPSNPAEYRVFAGSVLLTNDNSAARIRRIANFTIHPEYNTSIWSLGTPFLNNSVARLPIMNIGAEMLTCTFTGWGRNTRLHYAQMAAFNETMCRSFHGSTIVSSMVCGWAPNIVGGASPSWGDEGGPFVCQGSLLGILIQYSSYLPAVFTRAANYTTWINHVVSQPILELGPEPSTLPPPATTTTPSPGGASNFHPGMTVLAVVAAQIITVNVINKSFIKTIGF